MQQVHQARRRADGTVDLEFYRDQATRLRAETTLAAIRGFRRAVASAIWTPRDFFGHA